jgi:hypothetical protein
MLNSFSEIWNGLFCFFCCFVSFVSLWTISADLILSSAMSRRLRKPLYEIFLFNIVLFSSIILSDSFYSFTILYKPLSLFMYINHTYCKVSLIVFTSPGRVLLTVSSTFFGICFFGHVS